MNIQNKTIWITGANRGIGRARVYGALSSPCLKSLCREIVSP